jgi:hypothetical protein
VGFEGQRWRKGASVVHRVREACYAEALRAGKESDGGWKFFAAGLGCAGSSRPCGLSDQGELCRSFLFSAASRYGRITASRSSAPHGLTSQLVAPARFASSIQSRLVKTTTVVRRYFWLRRICWSSSISAAGVVGSMSVGWLMSPSRIRSRGSDFLITLRAVGRSQALVTRHPSFSITGTTQVRISSEASTTNTFFAGVGLVSIVWGFIRAAV